MITGAHRTAVSGIRTRAHRPEIKIDREFQALIPALSTEERQQLEQNLLRDGCRDPLVVWRDGRETLLDGHNRYEICMRRGLAFQVKPVEIESRDDAKIWIINNQFGRRNITPYQRAELALKLEPLYAARAKDLMAAGAQRRQDEIRLVTEKLKSLGVGMDRLLLEGRLVELKASRAASSAGIQSKSILCRPMI